MKLASDPFPISDESGADFEDMFGEPNGGLHVHSFSIDSLRRRAPVRLGVPARIYEYPCCSKLEVVGDWIYLAWARVHGQERRKWAHELIISAWKSGDAHITHHVVDPQITWNTHITMAKDEEKLVVAYHDQEEFRGRATIEVRSILLSRL